MAFALSSSASLGRAAFLGGAADLRATSAPKRASSNGNGRAAGPVQTRAFFNFGGVKQPAGTAMVCRDCGYIYRAQDFNDLPKDWKCPPCGSGKNAFRPEKKQDFKTDGFNARGVRAAKKENQAAFRAKRAAARKAAEQAERAAKGGKKGGLFGR